MAGNVRPVVVDANVAVKWFVNDKLSPQARSAILHYSFFAPWLILPETANALWKYVRLGVLPATDAAEAISRLSRKLEISTEASLASAALLMAGHLNHPAYDCFYLALAQQNGLPLLTADSRLASLAETIGLAAIRLDSITVVLE